MRRVGSRVGALALGAALAIAGLGACRAHVTEPGVPAQSGGPAEPAFIRGVITRAGERGGYLVEGTPGAGHREDKAFFRIGPQTELLRRSGGRAAVSDLTVGRTISLWITGPVLKSYPVQVQAQVVIIEDDPAARR